MKNRIRLYRKKKKLTQLEFAKLLNLTFYRLCTLERGQVLPSQELGMRIAAVLNVSIDTVFFIEDNLILRRK